MDINKRKIIIIGANSDIAQPVIKALSNQVIANETILISRSEMDHLEDNQKKIIVSNYKEDLVDVLENLELEGSNLSVVNFSGSLILKPLHIVKEEEFMETLEINLLTNFRALSKILKINLNSLSYVALSSVAANYGLANHEAISAAKSGLEGLLRSCASSYGHRGYRFNSISPSLIDTKMTKRLLQSDSARDAISKTNPLKKIGIPEDLSNGILWLLSDKSSFVTGQNINIDGGLNNINSRMIQ
tara:strand:- start:1604 stop:2338 length:735 start_codon:yes stop_codon:yes gene_type:complete